MISLDHVETLSQFKAYVRYFIHHKIHPSKINWGESEKLLFDEHLSTSSLENYSQVNICPEYIKMAKSLSMLRDQKKWALLYRLFYRIKFENKNLLSIHSDEDVREANVFMKSIGRDIHKMHAFVRFKRAPTETESYVAWHRPEHLILRAAVPFFKERFGDKPWSILTPDESAHFDGEKVTYSEGVEFENFNVKDDWDEVWKDYYKSIYNPARLNIKMMKQEMSPKYWQSMPESEIIQELIKETPEMLEKGLRSQWTEASVDFDLTITEINEKLLLCKACPLYKNASQVVRGVGPVDAKLMIIGEAPGDMEDKLGSPFVGPSGQIIDECLRLLNIKKEEVYFTNTVKHFSFSENEKGERIHKTPTGREVHACKPWLEAEINQIKPKVILALGVTAATAVLGKKPILSNERGKVFSNKYAEKIVISWHPSSILRSSDEISERKLSQFKSDLLLSYELISDSR